MWVMLITPQTSSPKTNVALRYSSLLAVLVSWDVLVQCRPSRPPSANAMNNFSIGLSIYNSPFSILSLQCVTFQSYICAST